MSIGPPFELVCLKSVRLLPCEKVNLQNKFMSYIQTIGDS